MSRLSRPLARVRSAGTATRPARKPFRPSIDVLEDRTVPSTSSSIIANFNGTAIPAGDTVWFNSEFQASGLGNGPVTLQFTNQTITFTANGTNYNLSVPNSTVTFTPGTTVASTTYSASTNTWTTALPSNLGGHDFLGGLAWTVPNGLPGNIHNVTWQGQMQSDTPNVQVQWYWGAAVYTQFATNYTALNVKPCDDGHASSYQNGDHAGTPEAFKAYVVAGATGDGHDHYTGNASPNAQLTPPDPPPPGVTYIPGNSGDYPFTSSNPLTSVAFNESDVLTAAAMNLNNNTFDVWYTDEHALTLGVNQVTVIAANGTSTTTNYPVTAMNGDPGVALNPAVGAPAATDPAGRPLAPSLYITDVTNNPNSRGGDWQYGGTVIAPSAVFGAWKSYTETIDNAHGGQVTLSGAKDPPPNQTNLGPGADAPPAGLHTEGYTAEVRWSLSDLTSKGILLPGHNYRFYVMVHDGDQNKSGGDVGQASYQLINPAIPSAVPPSPPVVPAATPSTQPAKIAGFVKDAASGLGLANVPVTLTEFLASGHTVTFSTTTGSDGSYSFVNLPAGTYSLSDTPPAPYVDSATTAGTVGGSTDGSVPQLGTIAGITLGDGDSGINYDFVLTQVFV